LTKPWAVRLADPAHIKPHEESIPELTQKLVAEIQKMGRIINPVVADVGRRLVLDGTHRVEAALALKLPKIPVYDVDYFSESVRLQGWARVFTHKLSVQDLLKHAARHGLAMAGKDEHEAVAKFVWSDGSALSLSSEETRLPEIYRALANLEKDLQKYGITYVRDMELEMYVSAGRYAFGYNIRRLRKEDVLGVVESGGRLPPKSTRHLVDRRPLYILFPVDMLKQDNADKLFEEWVRKGRWIELPAETTIDRQYDERVAIYYREDLKPLYPESLLKRVRLF